MRSSANSGGLPARRSDASPARTGSPEKRSASDSDASAEEGRNASPLLCAQGLKLSWDGGAHVVAQDVDLHVDSGETVCLVGKSGSGKTTVLHALSGLTHPVEGTVLVHGNNTTGVPGHVSYMLQKDLLLPHLRIIDNVCLPLTLAGESRTDAQQKADPLFRRFGLDGAQDKWPSQLSGGMRQRAAFLRTYLMGNDVVLLDEPFSALDALTRTDMREWYMTMARELGIASLVITHDVDEAVAMASRVYVLVGSPATAVEAPLDKQKILSLL